MIKCVAIFKGVSLGMFGMGVLVVTSLLAIALLPLVWMRRRRVKLVR